MTDADRTVAHGMGYESAVEATGSTAAPGHEEALAELAAENERLKRALKLACDRLPEFFVYGRCPLLSGCGFCKDACAGCEALWNNAKTCWEEFFLAQAANEIAAEAKAGDAK